ncbi:hypothetical protein OE749_09520 [Aestuariibacter sp. AA17]|uniref:Polymerase beta nucleotidyltransferase domain-containing protein n=1 Tax=Fluctibacter corallii TaxID=2984329 RepID=A0ABT3A8L9_9ALTE|nr:hypothetical protein [Aestuariibacter sp. AA17]MCV2884934.1 hypothetical protein [Aestuariibacter sp. AA17]
MNKEIASVVKEFYARFFRVDAILLFGSHQEKARFDIDVLVLTNGKVFRRDVLMFGETPLDVTAIDVNSLKRFMQNKTREWLMIVNTGTVILD